MSAPAALVVAKIIYPETEQSVTAGSVKINVEKTSDNAMEALSDGATQGLKLAANVGAMLVAFVATFISVIIGVSYGVIAGYYGGKVDAVMMRIVDVLYALPFLFLVILLLVFFGQNTDVKL